MGAGRILCQAILGPMLVLLVLMGHLALHLFFNEPEALKVDLWPSATKLAEKASALALRKEISKEYIDFLLLKNPDFVAKRCTDDFHFEDPIISTSGKEDGDKMFRFYTRLAFPIEVTVRGEHHGPHETVVEATLKVTPFLLRFAPISIPMRIHLFFEPPTKAGERKAVFKVIEEWRGVKLLTGKSVTPKLLGQVHSNLRKFNGYLASLLFKNDLL